MRLKLTASGSKSRDPSHLRDRRHALRWHRAAPRSMHSAQRSLRRICIRARHAGSSGGGRPGIRAALLRCRRPRPTRKASGSSRACPPSTRMRIMPNAARRSAKGSFDPLGIIPSRKNPPSVSSLSASATICPTLAARDAVVGAAPAGSGRRSRRRLPRPRPGASRKARRRRPAVREIRRRVRSSSRISPAPRRAARGRPVRSASPRPAQRPPASRMLRCVFS